MGSCALESSSLQYASSMTHMDVCNMSQVHFYNNSAEQYGGAVYADSKMLCIFSFHDYSSKVIFIGNIAKEAVGIHASMEQVLKLKHVCNIYAHMT